MKLTSQTPPDGSSAQAEERARTSEGDAVVGADGAGQAKVLEGPFEHVEGGVLTSARERLAGDEVASGKVRDREGTDKLTASDEQESFASLTLQLLRSNMQTHEPHGAGKTPPTPGGVVD